jgi:predicted nucleic acid-binding protein
MIEGPDESLSLQFFGDAAEGLIRLYTSDFTLAELLVIPLRQSNDKLVVAYEEFFASEEIIEAVAVDRPVLRRSAEIRARLGNRAPDAIHVATAVMCDCSVFVSDDQRIRLPSGLLRLSLEQVVDREF